MSKKISHMASPLPWFRMFAANFLSDRNFRTISLEERGLVMSMLLECWASVDIPKNPDELSQILGVPVNQVNRALTLKALSFFNERGDTYHSNFLDDQREEFLLQRKKQAAGGLKGAAIKKKLLAKTKPDTRPSGQPEGSLYQLSSSPIPSPQINFNPVNQEGEFANHSHDDLDEWIQDYDSAISPHERGVQA